MSKNVMDYLSMNEVILTRQHNYSNINKKYIDAINSIYSSDKYVQMSIFDVDGKKYYCVLIMRGIYLEPHFGVFIDDSFNQLTNALTSNDSDKIRELLLSDNILAKDGYTNDDSNLFKILSYVFSILTDYLTKKQIAFVKIMGNPKKFSIYNKIVSKNISQIPYRIIIREQSDQYSNKFGEVTSAKSMILKYKFA